MNTVKAFALVEVLFAELLMAVFGLLILSSVAYSITETRHLAEATLVLVRLSSLLEQFRIIKTSTGREFEFQEWVKENNFLLPGWKSSFYCLNGNCDVQLESIYPKHKLLHLSASI